MIQKEGGHMSGNIVSILIQLVSGGLGGLGAGKALPKLSLGKVGDIIAGIVGGIGGGQLLGLLGIGASSGNLDLASILTNVVGGGIGGGVLMAIVAAVKKAIAKK